MAEQGVPLKGLFGGQGGLQDMLSSAQQRKKSSRSPLRARACGLQQQSSDNMMNTEDSKLGSMKSNSQMLMKSRSASPDAAKHMMMMMMSKKEEGCTVAPRAPHSSYMTNPTFISKPTTPRDWPSSDKPWLAPRAHHDWERIVTDGKETNDGTHLIRLLADFIEEFQFGSSNIGNGENAS